jgi:succinate dehydrogenase / fumarate reductase cytochrome b subunit
MSASCQNRKCRVSSLVKKYLMALSGSILAAFVFGHMIGNLQMFQSPEHINHYAHFLQHLPPATLWGFRAVMLACIGIHVATGLSLYFENRTARPEGYAVKRSRVASLAAKTMPVTGVVLVAFIVFHLLHFTVKTGAGEGFAKLVGLDYAAYRVAPSGMDEVVQLFNAFAYRIGGGEATQDVYNMVVDGFSVKGVSAFYIASILLIFIHLTHGCASVFQSIGIRNEKWRGILTKVAMAYAVIVAAGFIAPSAGVLAGVIKNQHTESPRGQKFQPKTSDLCCPDGGEHHHAHPGAPDKGVEVFPIPAPDATAPETPAPAAGV